MALGRLSSGLLFDSHFLAEDADWIVTPSAGPYTWIEGGGLELSGASMALRPLPTNIDFAIQLEIDPTPSSGTCGLTLYREDSYQVRLVVFEDGEEMPTKLLVRRTDGVYLFMAEFPTSGWRVIGSIRDDQMLYVGAYAEADSILRLTRALCTEEEDLVVQGLSDGHEITIESGGTVLAGPSISEAGMAVLDLGYRSEVNGSLRVRLDGAVVAEISGAFYAGDIYTLNLPLSVSVNLQPVEFGAEYTVPTLDPDETLLTVDLFNLSETEPINGRRIRVSEFRAYKGVEWADVGTDDGDGPAGDWADEVGFPDLQPLEGCRVWIRIKRDPDIVPYGPLRWARFNVVII